MSNRFVLLIGSLFATILGAQTPEEHFISQIKPLFDAKCAACHSAQVSSGGMTLVGRAALLDGGNRGASIVPGDADASILIQAVRQSGDLKMPPGGKLTAEEIAALEKWVADGAVWPGDEADAKNPAADHWSFQPIAKPQPPAAAHPALARNAIDHFVQARLAKENLAPSPEADRATLIRRISLDLTGLPPSPEQVAAFVNDDSPDAYEKLVDTLLASPHFGERWARHWLDIAHYADSNGYNIDGKREIWKYRDWLIDAFNRDLPFDQFVAQQIAGDLLPSPTRDQLVATGFHRNTLINLEGGIDFEQYRVEAVVDRVDTVGAAFLGLTLGCARCHTHKYDPITQKEFYQFYAFYDSIDELSGADGEEGRNDAYKPVIEFGSPDELAKRDVIRGQLALLQDELDAYEKEIAPKQPEWEASLTEEQLAEYRDELRHVLEDVPAADRNSIQTTSAKRAFHEADLGWSERTASIKAVRDREPDLDWTMVMRDLDEPRTSYVHLGGDFLRKGVEVEPGTPAALPPLRARGDRADRLDLANWLVSDENPLTARVTVNRVWQRFFGLGIVETENDFGTQGRAPSHPELLDWLASDFRDNGWDLKDLIRTIALSHTYRQASTHRDDIAEIDSRNRLLSRQNRLRLEAEAIRDAALTVSGLLAPKIGGPSVFPPQPAGASKLGQMQRDWVTDTDENRFRRGMYTFFWRASPHPGLMTFDAPDSTVACTRRVRSNTPLQALTLLNDEAYVEFAQGLAKRVAAEAGDDRDQRLEHAFRIALCRDPQPEEEARLATLFSAQLDSFQTEPDQAQAVADNPEMAAWTAVSRVLLNLDEFITRE